MNPENSKEEHYQRKSQARDHWVKKALDSPSTKKVIVAGPGTGKTFLYRLLLEKRSNALTLSFVNSLVDDLELQLYGLSDVHTLHRYALKQLKELGVSNIKICVDLPQIISDDYYLINNQTISFEEIFHNLELNSQYIDFYNERRLYYDVYSHDDTILQLIRRYESDKTRIPKLNYLLVDEYQDFNALEVLLIELLSENNLVLITGNDDQALYVDLRNATPAYIRDLCQHSDSQYEKHELPYCSRCSYVIVEATKAILAHSVDAGLLKGRVKRDFFYFPTEQKDRISNRYPQIIHYIAYEKQFGYCIHEAIDEIACLEKDIFSILIISPTKRKLADALDLIRNQGLVNIVGYPNLEPRNRRIEALVTLSENKDSNVAWRTIARELLSDADMSKLIGNTLDPKKISLVKLLEVNLVKNVISKVRICKKLAKGDTCTMEELEELAEFSGISIVDLVNERMADIFTANTYQKESYAIGNLPVRGSTIQGSKGLSADLVILTHFDDKYLITDRESELPSDKDICSIIVAMTRARMKLVVLSTETSFFIPWLDTGHVITHDKRPPKKKVND